MEKVYQDKTLGFSTKETFEKPRNMKANNDCSKVKKDEELPGDDYEIIEGVDL
jgi:hypothetical protein